MPSKKVTKKVTKKAVPKKPAPAKQLVIKSEYCNLSGVQDLEHLAINAHGAAGSGKTMFALSGSKDWPKNAFSRTPKDPWITLTDVLHVGWDKAALVGLIPHKIRVQYAFNCPELLFENNIIQVMEIVSAEVQRIVQEDENVALVIHDTISAFDRKSLAYWGHSKNIPRTKTGVANKMWMWGEHRMMHMQYQTEMINMPPGVVPVFLFHEKVVEDAAGDNETLKLAKARIKKLGNPSAVMIMPDVSGNGVNFYTNDASIEVAVVKTCVKGKPPVRKIHSGMHGFDHTKNRFEHLITEPLPADIGALLDLIRSTD